MNEWTAKELLDLRDFILSYIEDNREGRSLYQYGFSLWRSFNEEDLKEEDIREKIKPYIDLNNILYKVKYEDLPLFVNYKKDEVKSVMLWRLKIGK